MKKLDLLEDLKMLQEFYTFLHFNFIMIDINWKTSVLAQIT